MLEKLERGKKYQVIKAWMNNTEPRFRLKQVRYSLCAGEILRFRGKNYTGAELLDCEGKLVILPVRVAFEILGNLTQRPADGGPAPAKPSNPGE